jgi:hypothetical protein
MFNGSPRTTPLEVDVQMHQNRGAVLDRTASIKVRDAVVGANGIFVVPVLLGNVTKTSFWVSLVPMNGEKGARL